MTPPQFTTICEAIRLQAYKSIPANYQAQLIHDKLATSDKGSRPTLMFSMWGKSRQGFWRRGYASYSIVHDPHKLLSQRMPLQVRFVYFHSRKESGLGMFNKPVEKILKALDHQNGFLFCGTHKTFQIYKPYTNPTATSQWQVAAGADLSWLIAWTLPAFTQMLGSSLIS